MVILRKGIVLVLTVFCACSAAQAAEPDWNRLIEFRDTVAPGSYEEAILEQNRVKPLIWEESEKKAVLNVLRSIYESAPGLIENPDLYGPIPLYRADEKTAKAMSGIEQQKQFVAFAQAEAVWFSDMLGSNDWANRKETIVHEFTHLVDDASKISRSAEFRKLVEPRIEKVRAELKKAGLTLSLADSNFNANTDKIARKEGLPRLYAATSLQEALACYAEDAFTAKGIAYAPDVYAFIKSKVFTRAPSADPSLPFYIRATALRAGKKLDEALTAINEALRLDPDFTEVYYVRAGILSDKGDLEGAKKDYTRFLSLLSDCDVEHVNVLYKRGIIFAKIGELDKALADFNEAIEEHPEDPWPYYDRARVLNLVKKYDKAMADLNKALTINPEFSSAYMERSITKYGMNDFDGAIADLDEAIKLSPRYRAAYHYKGLYLFSRKDYDGSIASLSEAIKLDPGNVEDHTVRGDCLIAKKDFNGAIADYSQAISLKANYAYPYYRRGYCKSNIRDFDGAIADFSEAIRIYPSYGEAVFARGIAYGNTGKYEEAEKDFKDALRLKPEAKDLIEPLLKQTEDYLAKKKQGK